MKETLLESQHHQVFKEECLQDLVLLMEQLKTYSANHLYDDLTSDFNGKNRQYALTVDKEQKTGISTNNALILINGILQAPGSNGDFELTTVGSGTTITFTGAASSVARDVNTASIPVGGVIISVASTSGFGYQPLVSAGGNCCGITSRKQLTV